MLVLIKKAGGLESPRTLGRNLRGCFKIDYLYYHNIIKKIYLSSKITAIAVSCRIWVICSFFAYFSDDVHKDFLKTQTQE